MSIKNWLTNERPREKLLLHGAKYLSDAELLAIFLRTGTRNKTALDIARDLLASSGGLKKLLQSSAYDLCQTSGIGTAKYAMLQAALELGLRYLNTHIQPGEALNDSQLTRRFLAHQLKNYSHEVFACLFLNTHNRLICFEELFHGTLNEASVYPREIVRRGLTHNAAKIILAHNHPSGNPTPSQADRDITCLLKQALGLVDIKLIDHIVIGACETVSFAELGLID